MVRVCVVGVVLMLLMMQRLVNVVMMGIVMVLVAGLVPLGLVWVCFSFISHFGDEPSVSMGVCVILHGLKNVC